MPKLSLAHARSLLPVVGLALTGSILAQSYSASIIYCNTPGHPNNVVPGTGLPFNAGGGGNSAFNRPWVSANGQHWAMTVAIESTSLQDDEAMLLDGNLVMREGMPSPWSPGEVIGQVFNTELGVNDNGDLLFDHASGTPGTPSPSTTNDYMVFYSGGSFSVLAQELQPVFPLLPGLFGDAAQLATWDDVMDSSRLTNTGQFLWRATGLDGLSTGTANDAVIVMGGTALQKGFDVPTGQAGGALETWETFDANDLYVDPTGGLVLVQGDLTGATTGDDVVVLNGVVVIQEGVPFGPFASPVDGGGVVKPWIDRGGNWYVRGDNADQNDWVVRNGVVVAYSDGTDPIVPGSNEHWDDSIYSPSFFGCDGNSLGQFLIAGVTDHPNVDTNAVIVRDDGLGHRHVVVREGDPVDMDGNGLFDDDRFIAVFGDDDMVLLDSGEVLFVATLRNGLGSTVDHAFLRLSPRSASCTLRNGSGINPVACTCQTLPIIGTTWNIALTPGPQTIDTFLFASTSQLPAFPIFGGEALIAPPATAFPTSLMLPFATLGVEISLQAVRLDFDGVSLSFVLTNAVDAVVGQ